MQGHQSRANLGRQIVRNFGSLRQGGLLSPQLGLIRRDESTAALAFEPSLYVLVRRLLASSSELRVELLELRLGERGWSSGHQNLLTAN